MLQRFVLCSIIASTSFVCAMNDNSNNCNSNAKKVTAIVVTKKRAQQHPSIESTETKDAQVDNSACACSSAGSSSSSASIIPAAKKQTTQYYNAQRVRNLYDASSQSYRLSRSQIENYIKCARCFYIDRKRGVGRPSGYPFSLNIAVDNLLKREFDIYRAKQEPHPYCVENNIDAIPFQHPNLETWRDSLRAGLEYKVPGTNILVTGGIDDVWKDQKSGELIVVDYKATSKKGDVNINADWQDGYKRQMEIYQWLFRKNGFTVSNTAYFVYCNGKADVEPQDNSNKIFDNKLEFKTTLIPYQGNDSWVEPAVIAAYRCLQSQTIPAELSGSCDYCQYFNSVQKHVSKEKTA